MFRAESFCVKHIYFLYCMQVTSSNCKTIFVFWEYTHYAYFKKRKKKRMERQALFSHLWAVECIFSLSKTVRYRDHSKKARKKCGKVAPLTDHILLWILLYLCGLELFHSYHLSLSKSALNFHFTHSLQSFSCFNDLKFSSAHQLIYNQD